MTAYHFLSFFHLLGAFCLFAGGAVAGTLQVGALRRERPSEILTLLRLTRVGVLLVLAGAVLTLVFGIALAHPRRLRPDAGVDPGGARPLARVGRARGGRRPDRAPRPLPGRRARGGGGRAGRTSCGGSSRTGRRSSSAG